MPDLQLVAVYQRGRNKRRYERIVAGPGRNLAAPRFWVMTPTDGVKEYRDPSLGELIGVAFKEDLPRTVLSSMRDHL